VDISNLQNVDEMTVVPLLGATRGEVAKPQNLVFSKTSNYGEMVFENQDEDCDAIIPSNLMVRGKDAQDHVMSHIGLLEPQTSRRFPDSCCIEESQGGYLENSEKNEFDILPIELRKCFLTKDFRENRQYDKLWGGILDWLKDLPLKYKGVAHLRYFYDDPVVKTQLETFAAEFEPVEDQIGAVILFSGIPMGIEIMPSPEYWDYYWKLLIRGSYGAELIRLKQLGQIQTFKQSLPRINDHMDLDHMKEQMEDYIVQIQNYVPDVLKKVRIESQLSVSPQIIGESKTLQVEYLKTQDGGGEMITQNQKPIYLSLVL